jgi:putative oxidoreductase
MVLGFLDRYREYGPLFLRIALGLIMMGHGSQKLFGAFGGGGLSQTAGFFDQIGIVPGTFWATIVAVVETFGGLLVFIGLLTRVAGLLIAITMLVAMVWVHLPNGFFLSNRGIEFTLALSSMAMALVVVGGGALSADALMKRSGR